MFDFDTPVDRRGTYCIQWDYVNDFCGDSNLLPFTVSDMDFALAPCIRDTLQQRLEHGVFGYSRWSHDDFCNAVCGWFARHYGVTLDAASLVYGPCVIYIVSELIKQWSNPGDGILLHTPAYNGFLNMLDGRERKLFASPLTRDVTGEYQCDWQQFESLASRNDCHVFLLCNPHNPTGRVWRRDELSRMAEICLRHNVRTISDEIHMDITFVPYTPWSEVALDTRWALVSSCSKSFNIPALGGAYAFIPDTFEKECYLNHLGASHGLSSPSIMGMLALLSAYQNGDAWLFALKDYLHKNLQRLTQRLNQAFPELKQQIPQGTYLAWIDLNPLGINMSELQQLLVKEYRLAIMPGSLYGDQGEGCLRFNVASPRQKVDQGIDGLIGALNKLISRG